MTIEGGDVAVGLTIIKQFTYRAMTQEEWSNQYWLTGSTPASDAAWRTLFDALVVSEKAVLPTSVNVVRGYGYDDPSPTANSVWSVDLTTSPEVVVPGTFSMTSKAPGPGDSATWIRWTTSRTSSKGKPIYLRKYYHPAVLNVAGGDAIYSTYITALNAHGTKLMDGSFLDARKITDRNHTDVITARSCSNYATTRTLKRRGRRPT